MRAGAIVLRWGCFLAGIAASASPAGAASCLVSATPVAFGIYDAASTQDAVGAGVVTVTCTAVTGDTADAAFSIAMSAGTGNFATRTLSSGANHIGYNIYTNAGFTSVWGDGSGGSGTVSDSIHATLLGVARTYTAYGRIPALQTTAAAGIYADTVIVTIAY